MEVIQERYSCNVLGLLIASVTYQAPLWYEIVFKYYDRLFNCVQDGLYRGQVGIDEGNIIYKDTEDLEVIRWRLAYKIKMGIPLQYDDWLENVGIIREPYCNILAILEDALVTIWQDGWNNSRIGIVTKQFDMQIGFLLTRHRSLNAFLYERSFVESSLVVKSKIIQDSKTRDSV